MAIVFVGGVARAETPHAAAAAEHGAGTHDDAKAKVKAVEAKPADKIEKKAESKPEKGEAETRAASKTKADTKTAAAEKTATTAKETAPGAGAKVAGEGASADAGGVAAEVEKAKTKAKPKSRAKEASPPEPIGQGPSPASPSPLNITGLHDELRRDRDGSALDATSSPHSKVEQMLAEVTKTRESLHEDASRLEAMLSQEGEGSSTGTKGAGPAGTPEGAKPPKNPLDVLAKALRGIKPEQAAPIVSRLDKRLAATVLQRMPPVDAGKILGAMKPDTAAELATQIALRTPAANGVKR